MRDWLTAHKEELKFVINYHCAGNMLVLPYNGEVPNQFAVENPESNKILQEIVKEAQFPEGMAIGASTETIGIVAGGDAGDWINHALHIPAVEAELGVWRAYNEFWFPRTSKVAFQIVNENLPWLEHTF